jgi:hypothetical protein
MHDLEILARMKIEINGTLHAVEVIVKAASVGNKQRGRYAGQIQLDRQILLKKVLNLFDSDLRLAQRQERAIALGDDQLRHVIPSFLKK